MPDDRAPITCHHCEWTGIFFDLSLEAFQDLAQYSCPECDTHLVLVSYAARPQSRDEDHAPRRITAEPSARGTVRMTNVEGGANMTPEEIEIYGGRSALDRGGQPGADPSDRHDAARLAVALGRKRPHAASRRTAR